MLGKIVAVTKSALDLALISPSDFKGVFTVSLGICRTFRVELGQ